MSYRTAEVAWLPRSSPAWKTFTASRKEAARMWTDMAERHFRIRRRHLTWPDRKRWSRWAKQRYPGISAQSAQQCVSEFLEAVKNTTVLRKKGHEKARYPRHTSEYRDVVYTNQDARIRKGFLVLPNGTSGHLRIKLKRELPGRMMEVRVSMGRVLIVCKVEVPAQDEGLVTGDPAEHVIIGVDLGVNTLVAATDGKTAILISGREAKATIQWRAKKLASISARQSKMKYGSRQRKRLQRRKAKMLAKARNRIRDITHKATRHIANAFPGAKVVVGKPFNDAARKLGAKQAQQVSSASNRKLINQLSYKCESVTEVAEHYTSQTCPICLKLNQCQRTYLCKGCGFTAPRDVVGCTDIRSIGVHGKIHVGCDVPNAIYWKYPSKYPAPRVKLLDEEQVVPADTRHVARECPENLAPSGDGVSLRFLDHLEHPEHRHVD